MDRRNFIGTVAGSLLVVPRIADAQQAGKLPRMGYLSDEVVAPHLFHSHDSVLWPARVWL
jgi:hypothetical protein